MTKYQRFRPTRGGAPIVAGPDGNLWFGEYTGNRVGRFVIGYPVSTVLPVIAGTATHGLPLTATIGTWTGTPTPTYAYKWQDCNAGGFSCATITGATSSTYALASSDIGDTVRVVVTATNTSGSVSASSAVTAIVN